jgi:RecA-family ATPase
MYSLNSTGLLYAKAAVGKSVLLLDQMGHVSIRRAWNGRAVHGGHVVYVAAEGAAFLGERLRALMLRLGVDDTKSVWVVVVDLEQVLIS